MSRLSGGLLRRSTLPTFGFHSKEKRTRDNILSETVSREVREISMRFGWCMACGKKARSVKASEEIYGRGLAWFSVVIVAGLIGGLSSPESKAEALGGLDQRLNPDLPHPATYQSFEISLA